MQKDCNAIKILLADDLPLLRDALRNALDNIENMQVVGEAANYKELHAKAMELRPDVIITGTQLADTPGFENIARLAESRLAPIIVYDNYFTVHHIDLFMNKGVRGIVHKRQPARTLVECIVTVYNGDVYCCNEADTFVKKHRKEAKKNRKGKIRALFNQTEAEVMQMICRQYTSTEIAALTHRSVHTVDSARKNLLVKTNSRNNCGIVYYAIKNHFFKVWMLLITLLTDDSLIAGALDLIPDSF